MNKNAFYNNIERYMIIGMFTVMIVVCAFNVFTRFVLHFTLPWPEQLVRYLLVWISFAGISWGGMIDVHMKVTAVSLLTKKHPKVFENILVIGDAVTVVYAFYLSYRIALFARMIAQKGQILSAIPWIPKWTMYLAGVLGMAGLGIRIIERRVIWFAAKRKGGEK